MKMRIHFNNRIFFFLLLGFLSVATGSSGQVSSKSAFTYTTAYSVLNAGTATHTSSTYVGNQVTATVSPAYNPQPQTGVKVNEPVHSIGYLGPLNKRWNISLGIPMQVFFDYYELKGKMEVAVQNNPEPYLNGAQPFRDAVDFLRGADFSPISAWAPAKCTVTFRFISPMLGTNLDINFDSSFNPSNAPVRGEAIFWIR
jgi:hypothetical protein